MARLENIFSGLDGGANGGRVKRFEVAEAGIEKELCGLCVGGFGGSLLRRKGVINVTDEDPLAEVGGCGFAEFGGLGVGFRGGADDVEARDATVQPEASDVRKVGGRDVRVEVEEDSDVVAAGFVDEVVEIIEGAIGGVDGLCVVGVGLDGSEQERVGAEGLDVVEVLSHAVETTAVGGAEVEWVDLIDDGVLPPDVGIHAGANPAGAGEGLGFEVWSESWSEEDAGKAEGEESVWSECDHASLI
jgi:hypothetical protein